MWLTALVLGFAGSIHCLGMCAPLAMAVGGMSRYAIVNRAIYNSGRILTYGLMGAVVASAGMALPFYKYQNILSIALGLILLIIGFGGIPSLRIPGLMTLVQRVTTKLKSHFAAHLRRKGHGAQFILGAINGLLPCGLTLIALTWCITLKGPLDGLNFMLGFGAGTLPVMLGLTTALPALAGKLRIGMRGLTTSMLIASGFLLIARVFLVHAPHADGGGIVEIMLCR